MLRNAAQKTWWILDALDEHVAVLDSQGFIIKTNKAWDDFASKNPLHDGSPPANVSIGTNYLHVCRTSMGVAAENSLHVCQGIEDVLAGKKKDFSLEYPCHSPTQQRWFVMRVKPLRGPTPREVLVMHANITHQKLVEIALQQKVEDLDASLAHLQSLTGQLRRVIALDIPTTRLGTQNKARTAATLQPRVSPSELNLVESLSVREREILLALVRGERNVDMAARLKLSTKSVSTYRARVLEKLNAKTNADLVALMMRLGNM